MTTNPVGWFEIYVNNMQKAIQFYEAVFNIKLEPLPNSPMDIMAFPSDITRVGCSGALVYMDGFKAGGNSCLIYFNCEDCEVQAKLAQKAGGQIFKPKTSIGEYGFISLVFDTDQNMIGLHSMR